MEDSSLCKSAAERSYSKAPMKKDAHSEIESAAETWKCSYQPIQSVLLDFNLCLEYMLHCSLGH